MRRPLLFWSFCLVVLIALEYCRGPADVWAGPPDGTSVIVTGQVCDKDDTSFELQILEILNDAAILQQDNPNQNNFIQSEYVESGNCDKLICNDDSARTLVLGAEVTLVGDFYAFTPATNPGEFDFAHYYYSMGYLGRLRNVELQGMVGKVGIREYLYQMRMYWKQRLYKVFPEKEASIMAAILLGEKGDVDAGIRALYERNGIVHILSISGLHITIIGIGIYKLLRRLGMPVWAAALCGGGVLVLYGMMTGFGVSVCRAVGMYLLRMLALLVGRTYDMLTALGVVGAVMALVRPAWLGHMGYLLSFGSVLGLGLLLPVLIKGREEEIAKTERFEEGRLCRIGKRGLRFGGGLLREGLLAGGTITLTTLPIQLWFSYEVSIYSVFLNALILPLMSAVMIAGLVAMIVPGLGFVGTVDVMILSGYEGLCHVFEKLPAAMWNPGRPAAWQVVVYYLLWAVAVWVVPWLRERKIVKELSWMRKMEGVAWPWFRGGRKMCGVRAARMLQITLLAAAVGILALPRFQGDRVTFLDVGQGDCICVQLSSGEVYLFDCGSSSRKGIGEDVLLPFLKFYGISEIDAVFASHGDADHINGLEELLGLAEENHVEIKQLVLPDLDRDILAEEFEEVLMAAREAGVPASVMAAGERWTCDEDVFLCLHPSGEGDLSGGNGDSQCFYIELQEGDNRISVLLTGDVEKAGEEALLSRIEQCGIRDVSVLKVAHHGSKYSTQEEVLEVLRPKLAVISCGRRNSYGHPHQETLERLEAVGSRIVGTPEYGAITVELGETVEVRGWKLPKPD